MQTELKTIEGRQHLVITLPLEAPKMSGSGKTLIVASSNGAKRTDVKANGKAISLTVSAWVKPD